MHHFCTWMHRQNRQVNNINKPAISVAICSLELDYSLQGSQTAVSSLMLPALNPVKNKQTNKKSRSAVSLWSDGCFTLIYQSQVLEPGDTRPTWWGDISRFEPGELLLLLFCLITFSNFENKKHGQIIRQGPLWGRLLSLKIHSQLVGFWVIIIT